MLNFNSSIKHIEEMFRLKQLPGIESHLKMAPLSRKMELKNRLLSSNGLNSNVKGNIAKESAVLILFYPKNKKIHLAMIKRPEDNSVHSGQIAFPGGKVEDIDDSLVETALREANEEVGINSDNVQIIGSLSKLHIPPSNFDVYPIVGYSDTRPEFITNEEVDRLIEVDFESLSIPKTKTTKSIFIQNGKEIEVPCYFIENEIIWGATAMMISELLDISLW